LVATHVILRASISAPTACGRRALLGWRSMVAAIMRSGRGIQLKATPTRLIGYFEGAIADDAIKRALVECEISDPLTHGHVVRIADRPNSRASHPAPGVGILIVFNDEVG
jgi:hypothetical protein